MQGNSMVVVDSSIIIHLNRINKLPLLREYFKRIKITQNIYNEIMIGKGSSEIEKACKNWILIVEHSTEKGDKVSELEGIEKADASIILLSEAENDILLSNDYALIMVARSKGIKCWWLTTFILNCIKKKIITKKEAGRILLDLVESGMRLDNAVYAAILKEIEKM